MRKLMSNWWSAPGAGWILCNEILPKSRFLCALTHSPSPIGKMRDCWLSSSVLKLAVLLTGMTVLRFTMVLIIPSRMSIPKESGATSNTAKFFKDSDWSHSRMAAWRAAPQATASSRFMDSLIFISGRKWWIICLILGIRVDPPIKMSSSISDSSNPASKIAFLMSSKVEKNKSSLSFSKRDRLIDDLKSMSFLRESISMGASIEVERSILASSQAILRRPRTLLFFDLDRSFLCFFRNSLMKWFTIRLSKSAPPRWVSPLVDLTVNDPFSTWITETSQEPPPRSKMMMILLVSFYKKISIL